MYLLLTMKLIVLCFVAGIFFRCPDKFNEESEHKTSELNNTNKAPLLEDEATIA